MDTKTEKLRIAVNQFYLNKYLDQPLMDDKSYDILRREYEADGASVYDLIEWGNENIRMKNDDIDGYPKMIVEDNDLASAVRVYLDNMIEDPHVCFKAYINLKYDGSSIRANYVDGKLKSIVSTPNEAYGILRTDSFWNMFPHELEDKTISYLRGEVLVDCAVYGQLSRNKANGLTNSKDMIEDIQNEAFIRIYKVGFKDSTGFDFNRSEDALIDLPNIKRLRFRPRKVEGEIMNCLGEDTVFSAAQCLLPEEIPTGPLAYLYEGNFQADGVVVYSEKGIQIMKFYFTESAITTVRKIHYDIKHNGSYAATVLFDNVTLNDKSIGAASSGGIRNMMDMKFGVGAKVKVILANLTIPKIIKVIEPSEDYQFPVCECGEPLTEDSIFGSVLKCLNPGICDMKIRIWSEEYGHIANNIFITDKESWFKENFFKYMTWLKVDRWNPESNCKVSGEDLESLKINIFNSIIGRDADKFKDLISENFRFTDLQYSNFKINAESIFHVTTEIFKSI